MELVFKWIHPANNSTCNQINFFQTAAIYISVGILVIPVTLVLIFGIIVTWLKRRSAVNRQASEVSMYIQVCLSVFISRLFTMRNKNCTLIDVTPVHCFHNLVLWWICNMSLQLMIPKCMYLTFQLSLSLSLFPLFLGCWSSVHAWFRWKGYWSQRVGSPKG